MNVQLTSSPFLSLSITWTLIGLCLLVSGCVEGRSSTHELEHQVPPHWPNGLTDAAEKIEARLNTIHTMNGSSPESDQAQHELVDIISWLPEAAADTPLHEMDWNKVHAACEEMRQAMTSSVEARKYEPQLRTLCAQLRACEPNGEPNQLMTELDTTGVE